MSIELFPMIRKRIFQNESFIQSINQGPASVVGLQFFSPADVLIHPLWRWAWGLIDWLYKILILQNPFFDHGQELYWHESYFKEGKNYCSAHQMKLVQFRYEIRDKKCQWISQCILQTCLCNLSQASKQSIKKLRVRSICHRCVPRLSQNAFTNH